MLKIMSKRAFLEGEEYPEHAFKRFRHHIGMDIGKKRIFSEDIEQNIEPDYTIPLKQHRLDSPDLVLPESSPYPSTQHRSLDTTSFTQEDQSLHFSSALRDFLGRDEKFLLDSCKPDPKSCQVVIYQSPLILSSSTEDSIAEDDNKEKFNKMDLS